MSKVKIYGNNANYVSGNLTKGCSLCISGKKSTLFITGYCKINCYFCPIPNDRTNISDRYINEIKINQDEDIFNEIRNCDSKGVAITGGDPLEVPEYTERIIKELKIKFGKNFHIHLYTSLTSVLNKTQDLEKIIKAGLDELRIHPVRRPSIKFGNLLRYLQDKYKRLVIVFEIPVIPSNDKKLEEIIKWAHSNKIKYINLNEFEYTESNLIQLEKRNFDGNTDNAAIKGSQELAEKIIFNQNCQPVNINYCTSRSKDALQLKNRFLRRAKKTKRLLEEISEDGELIYGRISNIDENKIEKLINSLISDYEVDPQLIDTNENEIHLPWYILDVISKYIKEIEPSFNCQIIKKYPISQSPIIYLETL